MRMLLCQPACTCSKSTMETTEQYLKYIQSLQQTPEHGSRKHFLRVHKN